ncbi:chorismate--pyruvate lyase family protein [Alcanivorax limicola]|uniref:chorismate--pyruvate lyase family protein n=1 Tax=Alcanivorax limicola TaxID=2874102 RepID=UPI001CBE6A84|nr:chorismate lyase [Alcanivorax limicola]
MKRFTPSPILAPAPRWRPLAHLAAPAAVTDWLADDGSLTHRLKKHGRFAVTPLRQMVAPPRHDEARLLGLRPRRAALIREVILTLDGEPAVFARSVLPLRTLTGANRVLGHMARRSLGAELFRRPPARRSAVWGTCMPASALPRHANASQQIQLPGNSMLWGRQSLFLKRRKPLLVAEIFLPHFWSLQGVLQTR